MASEQLHLTDSITMNAESLQYRDTLDVQSDVTRLEDNVSLLKFQLEESQEHVYQHSLTIVSLEDKLIKALSDSNEYSKENDDDNDNFSLSMMSLDKETSTTGLANSSLTADNSMSTFKCETADRSTCTVEDVNIADGNRQLESRDVDREELVVKFLQQRLFDLSEKNVQKCIELEDCRSLINKLQHAVHVRSVQVSQLRDELSELRSSLPAVDCKLSQMQDGISAISAELASHGEYVSSNYPILQNGVKCAQDTHTDIIRKQALAISEMRVYIKQLEEANNIIPSHKEALTIISTLKEELSRAKEAMSGSDIAYIMKSNYDEQNKERINEIAELKQQLEVERGKSAFVNETLHRNEDSLHLLTNRLGEKFRDLYRIDFRTLSEMSSSQQEREMESRNTQIEEFSNKLDDYVDSIKQTDTQQHESDQENIRHLSQNIEDSESQIISLKELNLSLKFQLEAAQSDLLASPKKDAKLHSCLYTEDMLHQILQQEKGKLNVKLRKKSKEIESLRKALQKYTSAE